MSKRIVDYLYANSQKYPDRIFIYDREGTLNLTYAEFWGYVLSVAEDMKERGWRKGDAMCIRSTQTVTYLIQYFACQWLGVVIIPLEHDLPEERIEEINIRIQSVQRHLPGAVFPSMVSDILFTSGTTGQPKGVVLSHQALVADAVNLNEGQGFHENLVFIINGPLNHAGCWTKVLAVVLAGASLYLMPGMKNLDSFFSALDFIRTTGRPAATFLVPASIRIMLQFSGERLAQYADIIEFIETGAAPMPHADMLRLCELLPKSRLFNTYASSETGVICTYNYNDGECSLGCMGRKLKLASIEIREDILVCKGPSLMMGYLGSTDFTQASMPEFQTTDLGRIDEKGRLFLMGRQNDVINVGGLKVSPTEVEEIAMSFEGIQDCICLPDPHPLMGFVPKLLVAMEPGVLFDKKAIALFLRKQLEAYKVPVKYELVDKVERTYNGKLNRKAYDTMSQIPLFVQ